MWNEFVLRSRSDACAERREPLCDADLLVLAAYLDCRLDEWETSRLEQRLIDEPHLLDSLVAAHAARNAAVPAPQPVIAYALNSYPRSTASARAQPALHVARRRRVFGAPAMAWSLAALVILAVGAVSAYVAFDRQGETITAETPKPSGDPLADDIGRRNDSVFGDPAKAYFDGTEVED